jgi:uncharacterized coiled-coil protein SlyX
MRSGHPVAPLLEFLSSQCAQLTDALQDHDFVNGDSLSRDFLFDRSLDVPKQIFEKLQANGWDNEATFDLFGAQISINATQNCEVNRLEEARAEQSAYLDKIQSSLGCDDVATAVHSLEAANGALETLRAKNKRLRKRLMESENRAPVQGQLDELDGTITEQHSRIQELEAHLQALIAKCGALQRDHEVKTLQGVSAEKSHNGLIDECAALQQKHLAEVAQFEGIIDEERERFGIWT